MLSLTWARWSLLRAKGGVNFHGNKEIVTQKSGTGKGIVDDGEASTGLKK